MYHGEVDIPKENLESVLRTASQLCIKGLYVDPETLASLGPLSSPPEPEVSSEVDADVSQEVRVSRIVHIELF